MSLAYGLLHLFFGTRAGLSADFLTPPATRQAKAGRTIFTVPKLDTLRKGGRIPAPTGLLGQLLQVRPVMHLQDGAIQLLDKPRRHAKALGLMTEIATSAETTMLSSGQAY